ncbi:MAG: GyrI-like domain-containing protein [Archangium sp.]|nr:GyrI-like domain-containing protein [Archangium sp.]
MDAQCTIEKQAPQPTLCVRTRTPVQNIATVLGSAFGEIMNAISAQGAKPAGMPYVGYRNMDMRDLDLEIGFPVSSPLVAQGRVQPGELVGGEWASTLHVGPYASVGPAWERLQHFITAQHRKPGPVAYEFYFDGPETPPAKIRTRITFPLAQ